ncbi:MAG: isochorismatase family protein, partial [Planctomycetaceae bacterium]|nr:isochorismatase family protein [Planctomycetaceae bacterium]
MGVLLVASLTRADDAPNALQFTLRSRVETCGGSGRHHIVTTDEAWNPAHTALIVCDVWDLHHSLNAVRREEEFAPRLNEVVQEARRRGVTIIHAPSSCMESYVDHPARKRAVEIPLSQNLPTDIQDWCSRIPAEEQGTYPLDQSDGGADDDPAEAKEWAAKLAAMGRNPGTPWKQQSDLVAIEPQDYISDKGDEVWSILEANGITNVILAGVHTNMCVLGRPFGLRQMAKNGKRVVLLRDMTDTMYNPAM